MNRIGCSLVYQSEHLQESRSLSWGHTNSYDDLDVPLVEHLLHKWRVCDEHLVYFRIVSRPVTLRAAVGASPQSLAAEWQGLEAPLQLVIDVARVDLETVASEFVPPEFEDILRMSHRGNIVVGMEEYQPEPLPRVGGEAAITVEHLDSAIRQPAEIFVWDCATRITDVEGIVAGKDLFAL